MEFPARLKELLLREAHLKCGREAIAPVLAEQEAALKALQETKPGLFASREKKDAYEHQLAEANQTLQLLRHGMAQLDRVEPHLRKLVYEGAEDWLRANNPDFLRALAVREQRADWLRCLQRFGEKVYTLRQALGNVRNMATSGYERQKQTYSQGAVQAFLVAINAGQQVEAEVKFANKVAEVQASVLEQSHLSAEPLPKLKEVGYAQWVALISNMPLAEAQQQFDQIISEAGQLYETGIPQLRSQAAAAETTQDAALAGFVDRELAELRAAIQSQVNPEETEASVADSEKMLNDMARLSVLGRLPTTG